MKKSILRNEDGVSPIIGVILLMAIGVTLLANMQMNSVPVWNLQEDLDHLEKMTNDINQLKSNIDNSFFMGSSITSPLIMVSNTPQRGFLQSQGNCLSDIRHQRTIRGLKLGITK